MKKLLSALAVIFAITTTSFADDAITRNMNDLPAPARTTLSKLFANTKVSYIKIEKDLFQSTSYDVKLVNGHEVSFDSKGNWTEVDCKQSAVPNTFIPATIKKQVNEMFPGEKITKIEKDTREYEIELSNDVDLKFDKNGKLKKVD